MNKRETNKKIAKALGFTYHPLGSHPVAGWHNLKEGQLMTEKRFHNSKHYLCRNHNELMFHTSWDWLMRAVEWMWSITGYRGITYQEIKMNTDSTHVIFSDSDPNEDTLINETYSLVINFINWYNLNKNNENYKISRQ